MCKKHHYHIRLLARILRTLAVAAALCGLGNSYTFANAWELTKNKNGIKVYTKEVGNTGLKQFKAITQINAPFSKVVGLIENIDFFPQWMHGVTTAKLIKKVSPIEQYAHIVQAAPPVKSRDFVAKALVSQNPKTLTFNIDIRTTDEGEKLLPGSDRYVRMTDVKAHFKISPLDQGKRTHIEYQVAADPSGIIPLFLVNTMAVNAPLNTLSAVKRLDLNHAKFIPTCVVGFNILGQDCRNIQGHIQPHSKP